MLNFVLASVSFSIASIPDLGIDLISLVKSSVFSLYSSFTIIGVFCTPSISIGRKLYILILEAIFIGTINIIINIIHSLLFHFDDILFLNILLIISIIVPIILAISDIYTIL